MHQIYSCSDENIEVFTTVIPSKGTQSQHPNRRNGSDSQSLLRKQVVIESDLYTPRPLELLPHRSDRRDAVDGRRFGRLQNARPPGAHPTKTPARPGESQPGFLNRAARTSGRPGEQSTLGVGRQMSQHLRLSHTNAVSTRKAPALRPHPHRSPTSPAYKTLASACAPSEVALVYHLAPQGAVLYSGDANLYAQGHENLDP
ncbi:Hypothetical predicted protein [Marmota monax]|uniref:Vexin n=1 Tax=Marmota monax TaxID=9995 RepID=A0A5E4CL18_MARMO|nr:hypothetical protein GHT09_013910 [Marmota monax]VTJ82543.1 Hypothetical predicted protein [Marmota monax]